MVIRQFTEAQYERFHNALMQKAQNEPLDASYTVHMTVNNIEYIVKIQPELHNKMAVLQALRVYREEYGPCHELITQGNVLTALLELLIYQGVS